MEEILKSLKGQHQLIVLISIVTVIIALTPSKATVYSEALHEVHVLQNGMLSYGRAAIGSMPANDETEYAETIRSALKINKLPNVYRAFYCDWPAAKAPINDYLTFLSARESVMIFSVNPQYLPNLYRRAEERYKKEVQRDSRAVALIRVYPDRKKYPQKSLDGKAILPDATELLVIDAGLSATDARLSLAEREATANIDYKGSVEFDFGDYSFEQIPDELYVSFYDFDPVLWLKSADEGSPLSLRALIEIKDEVGNLSLAEVPGAIESKLESEKRKVKFGEIEFDSAIIFWVAPLALCGMLLYYLGHVQLLRTASESDREIIRHFPWLGVLPGMLARTLFFITLTLLPTSAVVALSFRQLSGMNIRHPQMMAGWFLVIVLIGLEGLLCFVVTLRSVPSGTLPGQSTRSKFAE